MATQASFVTEMQTLNPVQQVQTTTQAQNSVQPSAAPAKSSSQGQTATIIQPAQAHSGQQFIVTNHPFTVQLGNRHVYHVSGDPGNEQVPEVQIQQNSAQGQVVYQPQYVDDSPDQAIYAGSNGQIQSYSDYNQGAMYSPVTGTYYQSNSGQMSGITQVGGLQGQILTHQGNTYVVQGGTMDGEGHPLTHTTRASPVTDANGQRSAHFDVKCWQREVQWLIDNYETAEGVSLPRSTLYNHYLRHCQEQKIDPMNPASFGKLIRSVFLGLRTRRLGTRGNSKYHYYGIRIKATSPLNQYTDEQTMAMRQQPVNNKRRPLGQGGDGEYGDGANSAQHQHQQFLGDASCAIPEFGSIQMGAESPPDGITFTDLAEFEELYKEHCEAILDIVVNLQFSLIEALWQSFWRNLDNNDPENSSDVDEHRLSKDKLFRLCRMPQVRLFVCRSDYAFYQALVEVLIPDVLRPIPSTLTQAIRNFAKSLEGWLKTSTEGIPDEMVKTKIGAVSAFAQTLRRYTSLNHLAQAARAVLQNTTQIGQMLTDLNRVDFNNVQEQASWVCQCEDEVVHQLEQDFKKTLQQQNSLEQWAEWLEGVVQQVLKPYEGKDNFPKAARQFLLKWSFYSSMVIRDLTLRSAASFGSFHLIRLLYDEYMFYLVEHKVANVTGETPIAVMGEYLDLAPSLSNLDTDTKPNTTAVTASLQPTIVKQSASMIKQVTPVLNTAMLKQFTPVSNATSVMIKQATVANANVVPTMIKQTNSTAAIIKQATTMLNGQMSTQTISTVPKSIVMAPASGSSLANLSNQIAASVHSGGHHPGGHLVSQVHAVQVTNPSHVTSGAQPKTIVVVPVSATTPGSGDAQPIIKKLKTSL